MLLSPFQGELEEVMHLLQVLGNKFTVQEQKYCLTTFEIISMYYETFTLTSDAPLIAVLSAPSLVDGSTFRNAVSAFTSFIMYMLYVSSSGYNFLLIWFFVCFRLFMHTSPTSWLYTVKNLEEKTMRLPCLTWTSLLSK